MCQRIKRSKKVKLHPRLADEVPWNKLCVDLIGHYKIRSKVREALGLKALTIIDPFFGWF